ncbi:hydroxyacid dehydrogenase [Candidatus Caldatribacterium sp.]|uniref:hydroxyacid dehydrogenase n=1 Tax=Candidatus Caldatribacterium sp. TaxID=2282143 RepID=UPI002991C557|nr:hydroxyacid dehydrogenase [Candidatus Caldatribacterium sp.]MDW8081800.1 hydroxyacid dehydrogenase [Candidatus Calescibacterium sp.]
MPFWTVLLPQPIAQRALDLLKEQSNLEVIVLSPEERERVFEFLPKAHALLVRSGFKVTREIINQAVNLRVICRVGVGLDNIDVEYAKSRGIAVFNVPGGNAISVAEHTLALLFALAKDLFWYDRRVREGDWSARHSYRACELSGKVIGLVGFGTIGQEVARLCLSLGMRVLFFDPFVTADAVPGAEKVEHLPTLLAQSDFVSLHVPLNNVTRHLIGREELRCMKPTAFLINVARGAVVDEGALYEALREGWIRGAALDVFSEEPPPKDHPFFSLPNVILTPHVAGLTRESTERVAVQAAKRIIEFFKPS